MNLFVILCFCVMTTLSWATSPPVIFPQPPQPQCFDVDSASCARMLAVSPDACNDPHPSFREWCCESCSKPKKCIDRMDCAGMLAIAPDACDDPNPSFRNWCCVSCKNMLRNKGDKKNTKYW